MIFFIIRIIVYINFVLSVDISLLILVIVSTMFMFLDISSVVDRALITMNVSCSQVSVEKDFGISLRLPD